MTKNQKSLLREEDKNEASVTQKTNNKTLLHEEGRSKLVKTIDQIFINLSSSFFL